MSPAAVQPSSEARVVLFSRTGCHLCEDARALVEEECALAGAAWAEVDIDASGDPALFAEYGELVPVVVVDGVRRGYWRIDRTRLRRALAARV